MKNDNDNTNTNDTPVDNRTAYFFAFTFKAGGIVNTDLNEDEVRERLLDDLSEIYGPEGFEITEVRKATDNELMAVSQYLDSDNEKEVPTVQ